MAKHMLTTVDNPYNPFTQWVEWYAWDKAAGHNSNALLARIAIVSDELSEEDQDQAIEDAIDEVILSDATGTFRKISENQDPKQVGS